MFPLPPLREINALTKSKRFSSYTICPTEKISTSEEHIFDQELARGGSRGKVQGVRTPLRWPAAF